MALPNHHDRRTIIDAQSDYVLVRRDDLDDLRAAFSRTDNRLTSVVDAALYLLDNARFLDDAAVGSAGDRMLEPDNPVRPVPATDNDDGELWRLLARALELNTSLGIYGTVYHDNRNALRDAIVARHGT